MSLSPLRFSLSQAWKQQNVPFSCHIPQPRVYLALWTLTVVASSRCISKVNSRAWEQFLVRRGRKGTGILPNHVICCFEEALSGRNREVALMIGLIADLYGDLSPFVHCVQFLLRLKGQYPALLWFINSQVKHYLKTHTFSESEMVSVQMVYFLLYNKCFRLIF